MVYFYGNVVSVQKFHIIGSVEVFENAQEAPKHLEETNGFENLSV